MSSQDVYNRHRALYSFKVLSSKFLKKSIELLEVNLPHASVRNPFTQESPPGSVEYHKEHKCLYVKCANNTFIEVTKVRVEGRKAMSAIDFNNGFLKKLSKTEMEFYCNKTAVRC